MKYKIGIIGGAGFIGASLARHLIKNFQVKLLDAKPPPKDPKEATNYHYCDIRNCEEVAKGLANVDLAIHAAIVQIPLINEQKKLGYEVNVIGTQNVCKVVEENQRIKGMILAGSWHTVGERDLKGVIDEEFGFRPDKVENRARLYALSKMAQEAIVRFYDEMSDKIYGITRMGTVLGDGMPVKTAANIFIEKGLKGDPITPFRHSMYRPMLYLDVHDACRACETYALKILKGESEKTENSLAHVVNLYHPKPINILHLAEIVKNTVIECSHGRIIPTIEIIDKRLPILFEEKDVEKIEADISKVRKYLGIRRFKSPPESISQIVFTRFNKMRMRQDPNSPQSKPRCN